MPEVPPALGWTVLSLVFLDEILLVVAACVAGAYAAGWLGALVSGMAVVAVGINVRSSFPSVARLPGDVAR